MMQLYLASERYCTCSSAWAKVVCGSLESERKSYSLCNNIYVPFLPTIEEVRDRKGIEYSDCGHLLAL